MSRIEAKAGFTLIEMMAVMLIIALVASLALTVVEGTGRAGLKSVVMRAAALIRNERRAAILTASDRGVSLDGQSRLLLGDGGEELAIPPDVGVDVLGKAAVRSGRRAVVLFHPDGASSGAALQFSRDGAAYELLVNWYTGRVAVQSP